MVDADSITKLSKGATFFRGDLHIHSFSASHDVADDTATPCNIVDTAITEGLRLIALTDHNDIRNVRAAVQEGQKRSLLVVPGVELSTPEGHLLCYAPTTDALEQFFHKLTLAGRNTKDCRCQTGVVECLNLLQNVGGFAVLAHIELNGAFESNMPRLTPAKLDILCHPALAGIEVTRADCPMLYSDKDIDADRKRAAVQRVSRLKLGSHQFLARIMNSDAHKLSAIGRNAKADRRITRYKMESPTFQGLRLALESGDTRVRIEDEIPSAVPIIQGVRFTGYFLDDQAIHFSPNLTCIIGGRGSGKSTAFEGLRLLAGVDPDNLPPVVDSDVWPEALSLLYRDETNEVHLISRNKSSVLENINDPVMGPTAFPVESYRQGETNDLSKRVQDDPLALLTFLDRLVDIDGAIDAEDAIRQELIELAPKLQQARLNFAKIPDATKELKLKESQVARLKTDKAEQVIQLQQKLVGERNARNSIEKLITQLLGEIDNEGIGIITAGIRESVDAGVVVLGAPEAADIQRDTVSYELAVNSAAAGLKQITTEYIEKIREHVSLWRTKEGQTASLIEAKRAALLSIQKLVADEARARQNLQNLRIWESELTRLLKLHATLIDQRWEARNAVTALRKEFGVRASRALKGALSDLFVSLKYEGSSLCPDAESLISVAMGWKTSQQLKAGALVKNLTLPILIKCIKVRALEPILQLQNEKGAAVFALNEAQILVERLAETDQLSQLETLAIYDMPKLSVTKRVDHPGATPTYIPRDFKRLSLGQQQSVLLALMLTSDSRCPLIIDQPEDNLDSEFIYTTLVPVIRAAKERRQIIVVTHNANIAVLGDAEQIVVLKATNERATVIARGSIDEPATNKAACAILEGSPEAFERRARVYGKFS